MARYTSRFARSSNQKIYATSPQNGKSSQFDVKIRQYSFFLLRPEIRRTRISGSTGHGLL
jgi:hypothetical protein